MENSSLKALNITGENKDPVKSLWRNVLIVALEDALGKGFKSYGMSYKNYRINKMIRLKILRYGRSGFGWFALLIIFNFVTMKLRIQF